MKVKIMSYSDGATDFNARKIPEADFNYICCSVILIDSIPKKDKNYYPQVLSKKIQIHWKRKNQYLDIYTDGLKFSFGYSNESDEK